jgi:hypothetical protein
MQVRYWLYKCVQFTVRKDKRWSTCTPHCLWLQTFLDAPLIWTVSQQIYQLSDTNVCRVYRSITLTSLSDALKDFGTPTFQPLFRLQIDEGWGHGVSRLAFRFSQNVLIDGIYIALQTRLLYYCQQFHCPTSVERLGLDCNVEYSNANQGIMPEAYNIWVQYMQSDENNMNNTFQGRIYSIPVLHYGWPSLN